MSSVAATCLNKLEGKEKYKQGGIWAEQEQNEKKKGPGKRSIREPWHVCLRAAAGKLLPEDHLWKRLLKPSLAIIQYKHTNV